MYPVAISIRRKTIEGYTNYFDFIITFEKMISNQSIFVSDRTSNMQFSLMQNERSSSDKACVFPCWHDYKHQLFKLSLSLFLDAFPLRPKMPFGQWYVAINIYNMCKWRHVSRGWGRVCTCQKYITHLIKIDHFARWWFLLYINLYPIVSDMASVYLIVTVNFPYITCKWNSKYSWWSK